MALCTIHERVLLVFWVTVLALVPMSASTRSNLSPSAIFRTAKPSIVLIIGSDSSGQPTVQGSGFIVAQDQIVTNHHVVEGSAEATAVFSDGATSDVTDVVGDTRGKE